MSEIDIEISIKGPTKSFGAQTMPAGLTFNLPQGGVILAPEEKAVP